MREIKFRAWIEAKKRMAYGPIDGGDPSPLWVLYLHHSIPKMQFTGLYDKNGKEIYEGDIVEAPFCSIDYYESERGEPIWGPWKNEREIVIFERGQFRVESLKWTLWLGKENKIEIIGNIYENPELCPK